MKISLKWLSDYVKLPPSPDEVARRLTMAGLEVEGMHKPGAGLEGVVVARIVESTQHPNADKLSVTKIDAGGEPLQVVCGAKNYKVGDLVPLATVGTRLPNGVEIKRAALRGVDSHGMLCSSKELGLSEESSGLLILDPELKAGTPIAQALGLDDAVLEVNVTPNRPDALSHLGIARDLAVLTQQPLRPPSPNLADIEGGARAADAVKIRIEDPDRCRRYAARVIENVTIGPSPRWLRQRLEACGVRAINNVVDVTNYALLEYGQPLHGFDLDRIGGAEIVVRVAKEGEKLTTLDGKERQLSADDLVIADKETPLVIAGVMGGSSSEVSDQTRRVLLESANFDPWSVRRSSKRHALHTESSHRFERGADIHAVTAALDRAAALIAELGRGTVREGRVDVYPEKYQPKKVLLRYARVGEVLGVSVPSEETHRILTALGFTAEAQSYTGATYAVPAARVDVEREEDLIEEVARIRGFDQIPAALPRGLAKLSPETREALAERKLRQALAGAGLDEVVNYSFINPAVLPWVTPGPLESLGKERAAITLKNPLTVEMSVMRQSLYAGLLQNVSHNLRHQQETVRLYEIGRTYVGDPRGGRQAKPVARETLTLSGVLCGKRHGRTWTAKDEPLDFFDAKGAVEAVLAGLSVEGATFEPVDSAPYHPRASARVLLGGEVLGTVGELHPKVAKRLDLPQAVFLFELDLEALYQAAVLVPQYTQLARFPAVLRDLAVVVPAELRNDEVRKVILDVGGPLVEDAFIFDVYTGKPIPEGKKNLAYAIRYRSADRTLTDAEVGQAHSKIIDEVNRRLGGELRGVNP
jgi:phenylalanyl-tRNA synthetase beta chain